VTVKYTKKAKSNDALSGVLRNVYNHDQALDQRTKALQISTPRIDPTNTDEWFVAEFQLAHDPCICNYLGKLEFEFHTMENMSINLQGRSISDENDLDESNYRTEDFMNLPENLDGNNGKPGTVIYRKMDNLMNSYDDKLKKYNQQLNDYQDYQNNFARKLVGAAKYFVVGGINSAIPFSDVAGFLSVLGGRTGFTKPDKVFSGPSNISLAISGIYKL
jgi:hypothetical protein